MTTSSITIHEHRVLDGDVSEMVLLDKYVSDRHIEKGDIVKTFIETMSDEQFEKYQVLHSERKAYLLRRYAEKHHGTNLGIVPYTA